MRYYVLCLSDEDDVMPYILAEVVRNVLESETDREWTIASALAGPRSTIATREELLAGVVGATALAAWDGRDDTEFDHETDVLQRGVEVKRKRHLRLVRGAIEEPPAG